MGRWSILLILFASYGYGQELTPLPAASPIPIASPAPMPSASPSPSKPAPVRYQLVNRFYFSPGLGLSSTTYTEDGKPAYKMMSITGKVQLRYVISLKWDASLSSNFTLMPLSHNGGDTSARFLGINFRAGRSILSIGRPWRLALLGGLYYTTMSVTDNAFGFANMIGPQIFPVLQRQIDRNLFMAYFKFSPIAPSLGELSLSNREFALGTGWGWLLGGGHGFTVLLDGVITEFTASNTHSKTTSLTVSGTYTF